MIKLENTKVCGFEEAIRGMRNPMNSWDRSDSGYCLDTLACHDCKYNRVTEVDCKKNIDEHRFVVGKNDHELMMKLAKGGPVHAKYRRMIVVYVDITAPLYWWKEFDTYKVGTVANSCSTMHKIHDKKFTIDDFSFENLSTCLYGGKSPLVALHDTIDCLNGARKQYLKTKDKGYWWDMIQLLPSSYNQKRTVMLNYEVLTGIYPMRKDHKLDEWHDFCDWIESLPYSEAIIG